MPLFCVSHGIGSFIQHCASSLRRGDYVGGGFLDDTEALNFQVMEDCGFTGSGGTGDDESFHAFLW